MARRLDIAFLVGDKHVINHRGHHGADLDQLVPGEDPRGSVAMMALVRLAVLRA